MFALSIILSLGFIYSARTMQEHLLSNVLRWPMQEFDTTPLGRILNRFSKDVDTIDNILPQVIKSWIMMFFAVKQKKDFFFQKLDAFLLLQLFVCFNNGAYICI